MDPNRKISHSWEQGDTSIPSKQGTNRSGQGVAVPALLVPEPRLFGRLPRPPFISGNAGSPSSSTDVTASRMMQTTCSGEDDGCDVCSYVQQSDALNDEIDEHIVRTYLVHIIEGLKKEDDDLDDTSEVSVAGCVAGVSLPLGMSTPRKKGTRAPWKAAARAFGNAKRVRGTR